MHGQKLPSSSFCLTRLHIQYNLFGINLYNSQFQYQAINQRFLFQRRSWYYLQYTFRRFLGAHPEPIQIQGLLIHNLLVQFYNSLSRFQIVFSSFRYGNIHKSHSLKPYTLTGIYFTYIILVICFKCNR